jgi:uncharacterized protein
MDITPIIPSGKNIIKAYGNMGFKINDTEYHSSLIVLPNKISAWNITSPAQIAIDPLQFALENAANIEILLIGCGEVHMALPPEISQHFNQMNIGVEIMTTGAACRTYNVLLSEGRDVAAALMAV